MNRLHPLRSESYRYAGITGTGGIGSGIHFFFNGNETLGRNESRAATLLPYKDFCKQHVILHYIAVLLGAGSSTFAVRPIGKVGNDEAGRTLVRQMAETGMDTAFVHTTDEAPTLFSVCYQYPDKSGGNITSENSASSLLTERDIDNYFSAAENLTSELILSVPEVPVAPRIQLMRWGRRRNCMNIASVLSGEVNAFREAAGFAMTDLLAINIDEAESIAGAKSADLSKEKIINRCIRQLVEDNRSMTVLITDGPHGTYCYFDNQLTHYPAYTIQPVSTAGAGDAFLAGVICGICCGLSLAPNGDLPTAVELGNLLAAFSVTSPDTINGLINADTLKEFSTSAAINSGEKFQALFKTLNA